MDNLVLSYRQDSKKEQKPLKNTGSLYPFGLKHQGYNGEHKIFDIGTPGTVVIVPITPLMSDLYKYKFQGTELQEELGLNMYARQVILC